jgi:AcrR family transcriptional regulator
MSRLKRPAARAGRGAAAAHRPRPTYHHGDLRSALLDQVCCIIREQGVGFVSIREVARRARVSHAAPAHHFGNKSGLLTAFATQGYDRLAACIRDRLTETGATRPEETIAATGQGYVRFALQNREHFSIMFPGDLLDRSNADYRQAADTVYKPFMEIVTRAGQEGRLVAAPVLVGTAAWSLVHGLASLWLSGGIQARTGARDPEALTNVTTRLFVDSVVKAQTPATTRRASSRRRASR